MTNFTPAGAILMWLTETAAPGTVLTLSGPGLDLRQEHRRGETPVLSLVRPDGASLPDGVYTWELQESFAGLNDGVDDPENGRDAVDPQSAPQRVVVEGRVESGVFMVRNGVVVDSVLEEMPKQPSSEKGGDS